MGNAESDTRTASGAGSRVFGTLVRQHRQAAALSQAALAMRAGLSTDAVSVIERGKRGVPRPDTVALLARALDLSGAERAAFAAAAHVVGAPEAEGAPAAAERTAPHSLPASLSTFIGREREIAAIQSWLREPRGRLLTLTGAGGVGKTRLALAVAEGLLDQMPDGVWLVDLASLADPSLVPRAVAMTLGIQEVEACPLTDTLAAQLKPRRLLLVLDNCEHLLDACAALTAALLAACRDLRILATSRAPLGVVGEQPRPVPALSLPPTAPVDPPDRLLESEAVRLFLERAQVQRPDLSLTEANAEAVVRICRQLEGIPLALELAAARVSVLGVEQLADRLGENIGLLTGGPRTALPRQRTLRATLDWSFALLTPAERVLLRRLAVFTGGWTLEAAEAVCTDYRPAVDDESVVRGGGVLDLLGGLAAKSLAQVDPQGGAMRYRFLEPIRQYAHDMLAAAGELPALRDRHLDWYALLAEEAEPSLWAGARQRAWMQCLEVEHENIRAALRWAVEPRRLESGLRLAGAIRHFWDVRGYRKEGCDWLEALLAERESAAAVSPAVRARALIASSTLAYGLGNYARAAAHAEEGLALSRQLEDQHGIASAELALGLIASDTGDLDGAAARYTVAEAGYRTVGDKRRIAAVVGNLANICYLRGDYAAAAPRYEELVALLRVLDDAVGLAQTLANLGNATNRLGDPVRATVYLEESLHVARQAGSIVEEANALANLAAMDTDAGNHPRAVTLLREAIELHRRSGDQFAMVVCLVNLAQALHGLGHLERAAMLQGAVVARCAAMRVSTSGPEWDDFNSTMNTMRQALGPARHAAVYARGGTLSTEQVIGLALAAQ